MANLDSNSNAIQENNIPVLVKGRLTQPGEPGMHSFWAQTLRSYPDHLNNYCQVSLSLHTQQAHAHSLLED